ncbi:MAG TPA: hypothetical protein VKL19_11060 [Thermoanaerobaculia bacterium]|nr:hypothetical protein [Thermoanaerobaculia bacterium]
MARPVEERRSEKNHYVAAPLGSYEDCIVYGPGQAVPATYQDVYGPDTRENCERWKKQHCAKSR